MARELLQQIAQFVRALGFRGSGQHFRKYEGDFAFVVNIQGSSSGDKFYVNLGAQPVFIPAEGNADLKKLEEYECVLRTRVGDAWPWQMPEDLIATFQAELTASQAEFFGHAQTLRETLATGSVDHLLEGFTRGTSAARASLHLARAAKELGHVGTARELVERGLELADVQATSLRAELQRVLE